MKSNKFVRYIVLAVLIVAILLVIAFSCAKKEKENSQKLVLEGEWKDIMTESTISFDNKGNLYIFDTSYTYTYDEKNQKINISYTGGYTKTLICKFENGYWKLIDEDFTYVRSEKRDEIRSQVVAEKFAVHTKDRTEALVGQTYTTADGIKFTIINGEMKNTPALKDAYAVVNLYIDCDTEISLQNWLQSGMKTPSSNSFGNTYFEKIGEGKYVVSYYQNIGGVSVFGETPHDYGVFLFDFGGTKYYIDVLKLNLIAE